MLAGLEFLHGKGFAHGSITPEKILHNAAGEVKLSPRWVSPDLDVGQCCLAAPIFTYMSCERCLGESTACVSDDIWSVGVVVHELATNQYPFANSSFPALFEAIVEKPSPQLDPDEFSRDLCEFTVACLNKPSSLRLDAASLARYPFVTSRAVDRNALAAWLASL